MAATSFNTKSKVLFNWLFIYCLLLTVMALPVTASQPQNKLLILGDSISAGYGINPDMGWVTLLEDRLRQQYPNFTVVNGSISGNTTADGLARLPKLLMVHKPAIVIIELGGNDGLRGYPLKLMRQNLNRIIEESRQANAKVLLVGIEIPPNYGERYTKQFRNSFKTVATNQQAELVPFILDGVATQPELMQEDGIHPTALAQPQLLDNVWISLEKLITQLNADSEPHQNPTSKK